MKLQVYRDGQLEQERELLPGTYIIGRADSCDLVLLDKDVSRQHAKIEVTEKDFTIEDLGSTNGILFKGKRINRKKFSRSVTLNVGVYQLTCLPAGRENDTLASGPAEDLPAGFSLLAGRWPRLILTAGISIMILAAFIGGRALLLRQQASFYLQQLEQEAKLVAECLVEMNRPYWDSGSAAGFRVTPFDQREGVVQVFIMDAQGKILAPLDKAYQSIDHPLFKQAIQQRKALLDEAGKGQRLLAFPARSGNKIIGLVAVVFNVDERQPGVANQGLWSGLVLLSLLLLAGLLAVFMLRVVLAPWRALKDAGDRSLAEGAGSLAGFKQSYKELADMCILIERLLVKTQTFKESQSLSAGDKDSSPMPSSVPSTSPNLPPDVPVVAGSGRELLAGDLPACIVEPAVCKVVAVNTAFDKVFALGGCGGGHLLEIFSDPKAIEALNPLLEQDVDEVSLVRDGRRFMVHRQSVDGDRQGWSFVEA